MSLSTVRLHQLLVAAAFLVPCVVLLGAAWWNRTEVLREADSAVQRTAAVMHEHASKVFDTAELAMDRVDDYVFDRPWGQIGAPATNAFLSTLKAPLAQAVAVWVVDPEGVVRASSRAGDVGAALAGRDIFAVHRARDIGIYVGPALREGEQETFAVSRRRSTEDGRFDGVIVIALGTGYFGRFYAEVAAPTAHEALLLRADGAVLVREPERVGAEPRLPPGDPFMRAIHGGPQGGFAVATPPGRREARVAWRRVGDYPVQVAFSVESRVAEERWYENLQLYGAVATVSALTLVLMAWLALRRARAEEEALARLTRETAQRAAAEERLRQSQKMEAVGQLTGGIAHDFNNLLAVITGSLEVLQRRLARGDTDVGRFIEGALDGADRAAKLTHRLLAFARQQPLEPRPTDPNRLITGMVDLLRRTLGETVTVETRLAVGVPPIFVDQNQLENAILNLAVNARDAMPGGGRLTLETARDGARDGRAAVAVTVRDTGTGMPPEVVARAFEPFFTTKPQGRGTGLGLSQVYGFVTQSGGEVRIDSAPGLGTAVVLILPVYEGSAPVEGTGRGRVGGPAPPRQARTVLVVEDDAMVRRASAETIGELGYRTITAPDGAAALACLDSNRDVAVLFTDVVMPGLDGPSLAAEARRRRPDLKVVFATGHGREEGREGPLPGPGETVLRKPFTIEDLAAALQAVSREEASA
ncbi:integral membrane sensor hybrid histidine kinase [Methylobacterium sp. 4-46]|uniref:ATP-binding protein n=1 Tax=unclassified Methylobacterium TaxID=2615210 RepID=UPI000152D285|nr:MULTISPECIES: ATP-binding protein [Methylobacterium]ACA19175.1 integral membrane sensor hybrid histidine kinase [Methylobacterium sp. 4-46]WFT78383.1 ATP-binding protein [Methylobacterium nodulans]